ncbi:hypothetical protein ACET3Z_004631 [Daucus carota]
MENSETKDCVRVAVNIRPLVTAELAVGCTDCITVPPGEPKVNRDPAAAQMQRMQNQIERLQAELLYFHGDSGIRFEELQILKHKVSLLEASNAELQRELQECRINCKHLSQRAIDAQVEKDNLIMTLELALSGRSWEEIDADPNQRDIELVKNYVMKIQELEGELLRLQKSNTSKHHELADYLKLDVVGYDPKKSMFDQFDTEATDTDGEAEVDVKELEHSSIQEKLDMELKELDKKLEQKEAEMKRFGGVDTSVLSQHYEKKVLDLEQEKKTLQKEIEQLRCNLANISSSTDGSTQKLKENYLQKLNFLESQVSELKKKQDAQAQLLRQKQMSEQAAKCLQEDIQRIKTQKASQISTICDAGGYIVGLLEDMDTSESEHSDREHDDDRDWEASGPEEESGWGYTKVKRKRRQKSGLSTSSSAVAFDLGCSCSKNSSCKTRSCECRAAGGSCCLSCRCHPKKCSNRVAK